MKFRKDDVLKAKDWRPGVEFNFWQQKYDGMRILLIKDDDIRAMTRDWKSDHWKHLREVPAIREAVNRLPRMTVLDCELWVPDTQATSVITHIKSSSPQLRLTAFACPILAGVTDLRWAPVQTVVRTMQDVWPDVARTWYRSPETSCNSLAESLLAEAKELGIEGYVLKQGHYRRWWKLKPVKTCDLVVRGISISYSAQHYGKLKAIKVGPYGGKELASVGSGFSVEFRHSVWPQSLIGKVAEIEYDSLAANGKLKFPRFVQWRDDKSPEECTGKDVR